MYSCTWAILEAKWFGHEEEERKRRVIRNRRRAMRKDWAMSEDKSGGPEGGAVGATKIPGASLQEEEAMDKDARREEKRVVAMLLIKQRSERTS